MGHRCGLAPLRLSISIPHSRPTVGEAEAKAVYEIVCSGQLAQGAEVEKFESEMAVFTGRRYGVAVSSGTAALHLGLLALGVGAGQEVIVPSYVCTALLHAVWGAGAEPVVCDSEPHSGNIDPAGARRALGRHTAAIIAPHMFGLPAEIEALASLGVPCIEDCAMSIGANFMGRRLGSFGEISICSFYATKMLAAGEGGMVLTDSEDLASTVRQLREYDGAPASRLRFNSKMTDMAAALGRVQLARLPEFVARRRALAALYDEAFAETSLETPLDSLQHIYYRYVVKTGQPASKLIAELEREGVAARRPIYNPLHRELRRDDEFFPGATDAHAVDVSLPLYPALKDEEAQQVIAAVCAVAANH